MRKINIYCDSNKKDFYGGWGKLDSITDVWTMVGYYANKSDSSLQVIRLEYWNPEWPNTPAMFEKYLSGLKDKPLAVLKVNGQYLYFYVEEE